MLAMDGQDRREVVAMMSWDGGWSWWGWLVMGVVMVGFWAAIAWVVVTLIRSSDRRDVSDGPAGASMSSAERILAERYARGEIDSGEYHQRLDDVRSHQRA
jgi:putative membrane protein